MSVLSAGMWMVLWCSGLAWAGNKDFEVDFSGCTEFAGIGSVPAENAEALVPPGTVLAGDGIDAVLVVRAVECDGISVDGQRPSPGRLSQIGLTIVGPDGDADIDNATLWYVTDHPRLHAKLTAAGVDTVHDTHLEYDFAPTGGGSGTLSVLADPPRAPDHSVDGTAQIPTAAPVPFVARWWAEGPHGTVEMRTDLPQIAFGSASTTLTTSPGSELADLIGDTAMTFGILDSYNAFQGARMEVTVD